MEWIVCPFTDGHVPVVAASLTCCSVTAGCVHSVTVNNEHWKKYTCMLVCENVGMCMTVWASPHGRTWTGWPAVLVLVVILASGVIDHKAATVTRDHPVIPPPPPCSIMHHWSCTAAQLLNSWTFQKKTLENKGRQTYLDIYCVPSFT